MSNGDRRIQGGANPVAAIAAVVALLVIVAGVYLFVIRDDDKKNEGGALGPQTLAVDGVPFSFTFPGNFATKNPPPAGFVWMSGIGPYDVIDIKRLENSERSLAQTKTSVKQILNGQPQLKIVGEGTETYGGIKMLRLVVDTQITGDTLRSQLFYFSHGGASWQFECQSTAGGRTSIDAACSQALGSFVAK